MRTILVTGGAGFIGSNFIKYLMNHYLEYRIINLDSLTYAGNLDNLKEVANHANYVFIKGDIRDRQLLEEIFTRYDINYLVNFAAETHVDRSITDPEVFLTTNVVGTHTLLEVAKKFWKLDGNNKYSKDFKEDVKFIQISTDEVYGALGEKGLFVETMLLQPNSPYSASKASGDLIVRSYYKTYGMPVCITRCSNNYGPYQFPEKLIPLMIHNCLCKRDLPIYGDGKQIRDWIHVDDHCSGICEVLHKGKPGEIYNIGGNNEKTNLEIVKLIIKELDTSDKLIKYVPDRPGHDRRYAIDNTKITNELGWKPKYSFNQGMKETILWYVKNKSWIDNIVSGSYKDYYKNMYGSQETFL